MEINKPIADWAINSEVEGFYVLNDATARVTNAGKPFLTAVLSDQSGSIEAKVWDYSGPIGASDNGRVVKIRGVVGEYRGARQLSVERIRLTGDADHIDLGALVPTAPMNTSAAMDEVRAIVASISDADYRAICETILSRHSEDFAQIPAAKSVHHGFRAGLLMHTLNMLRTADFLSRLYGDTLDRSLLLAGTLLHDFGKAREFRFSELGLVTEYSVAGELLGHLVMGAQEVAETAKALGMPQEKSVLLQHMLLSHHGDPEFGAAVRPMCAESELLAYIDLIDSRMEIYREELSGVPVGTFSGRIFALEKKIYHHA